MAGFFTKEGAMKLDGFAVQHLLSREFGDVTAEGISPRATFDYPMLYDVAIEMRGHVVLVPAHERPSADLDMGDTLCVCMDAESARSAREAGAATVTVNENVVFQHLYNRMQRIFVQNERLDAQLHALVDTFAGFQPLLDACARITGYPCALIDEHYRLVCKSSSDAEALESDSIDLFMASPEYRYMRASRTAFTMPNAGNLMMKNVFSKGRLVGSLMIEHRGDALDTRFVRFLLNYLVPFVEEAYARIGSFGLSSIGAGQVKAALCEALSGNAADIGKLEAILVESGHQPGADYVALCIERTFTNEGAEERDYLVHRLELAWPYAYCFTHGDGLFMLVDVSEGPQAAGKAFVKELPIVARENLVKVGISRTFSSMRQLDAAALQAGIALECGSGRDPMNWCYRFGDYAFSWLVARAVGDVPPESVCHPAVTVLLSYDEANGTDLLHTLATFMRCRYNATSAARELFVARSTLLHRLTRIEELVKVDFDNPADMAYLALSLAMLAHW